MALKTLSGFFAFGFGSGLSPKAPGTVGTLAALPLFIPLMLLPMWAFWVLWVVAAGAGVYWCEITSRRLGVHDHGGIVWDEMVAFWLVLAWVPATWHWWLMAFIAFRAFDIFKPWPICLADEKIHGGLGIMLDDLLAAAYSLLLLIPLQWWMAGRL